jgi:hypothetical protein
MDVPYCYISKEFHKSLSSQFKELNRAFKSPECRFCKYYDACIGFDVDYVNMIGEKKIIKEVKLRRYL